MPKGLANVSISRKHSRVQTVDQPLFAPRIRHLGGASTIIDETWRYTLRSPHWRLYLNDDAGAWVEHPRGRLALAPGRIVLLPSWGGFASGCSGRVRHRFLHFEPQGLDAGWDDGLLAVPQVLAPDPLLDRLAERCFAGGEACSWWARALVEAALAAWFGRLPAAQRRRLAERLDAPDPLAPALRLAEERLAGPLPVAALAQACGCSEDTLARLMRARLGRSPAAWVRQRRCARATELLTGDAAIEEVALRCGFANRHHFTRVFAAEMGCGPAEHRRRLRAWSPATRLA
jgi:AraC-like DNA-binding protein